MFSDIDSDYNNTINIFESDLNELNVKDPDTLYCRIESNLQALIDIYSIYSPFNKDINKLTSILDTIYTLHENCTFDAQEDMD